MEQTVETAFWASHAPLVQSSDLGDAGRKPRLRNGEPAVRLAAGLLQLSELTLPISPYLASQSGGVSARY